MCAGRFVICDTQNLICIIPGSTYFKKPIRVICARTDLMGIGVVCVCVRKTKCYFYRAQSILAFFSEWTPFQCNWQRNWCHARTRARNSKARGLQVLDSFVKKHGPYKPGATEPNQTRALERRPIALGAGPPRGNFSRGLACGVLCAPPSGQTVHGWARDAQWPDSGVRHV